MKTLVIILFWTATSALHADILGVAYEPGSKHGKKLFTYRESLISATNTKNYQVKGTYLGLDGAELVVEQLAVKDDQVTEYTIQHKQTNESGSLTVKDGKLIFSYTVKGKTSTSIEEASGEIVVGLSLIPFIEKHWAQVMKGETVSFRYAVLDRRETVGFKIFKSEEGKRGETPTITIKMKPTSFVIAAIVEPVFLIFSAKEHELLEIIGRTLPKKVVKGEFEDQDPEMVFKKEKTT